MGNVHQLIIRKISKPGLAFIAGHEGKVLKAYRCPAGVITIGYGFTMGSRIFAEWWRAKHGRALQMGDTLLLADADMLLETLINQEYGRAVADRIGCTLQHHHDSASSMTFNCGIGATGWRWAQALKAGNANEAATLLTTTAITANGRPLNGLMRRRREEAHLMRTGDYALTSASAAALTLPIEVHARLEKLGHTGLTPEGAVKAFQRQQGLTVDGLVGPATRAAIVRAEEAKLQNVTTGGGAVAGGGAGAATEMGTGTGGEVPASDVALDALPAVLGWSVALGVAIFAGWFIWRNRGWIFARLPEGAKDWFAARGIIIGRRVAVPV